MIMDRIQIRKASLPVFPARPPTENSTSAGTPLAHQNAPVQLIERWSLLSLPAVPPASTALGSPFLVVDGTTELIGFFPQ